MASEIRRGTPPFPVHMLVKKLLLGGFKRVKSVILEISLMVMKELPTLRFVKVVYKKIKSEKVKNYF